MRDKRLKPLLNSKYRREMWRNVGGVIRKIGKAVPITSVYLMGSFTTKKRRPADVDFIVLLKTKSNDQGSKWSADFILAPDNRHGEYVLEDAKKWMRQKYGSKKSSVVRLK